MVSIMTLLFYSILFLYSADIFKNESQTFADKWYLSPASSRVLHQSHRCVDRCLSGQFGFLFSSPFNFYFSFSFFFQFRSFFLFFFQFLSFFFYRTRVRSLLMLVGNSLPNSLTHSLLFSKLDGLV